MGTFSEAIIIWQKQFGRHDLPWQNTTDPYAIWVSEIMLQQTQVTAVIGYYANFMKRFPTITSLANATQENVLQSWSGLGYYSRARNLHNSAQKIVDEFAGVFPHQFDDILSLPGIGRSTAAAISTFALNNPHPILDGNVKRVFARHFLIQGWTGTPAIQKKMWAIAERENPTKDALAYTQGLMDLGATVCTRSKPKCNVCPLNTSCIAFSTDKTLTLPTPKPRKVLPEKNTTMYIWLYGNEILLEKRPANGIWGGLWSLPEVNNVRARCRLLNKFTHTFTHFKLHIQPQLMYTNKPKVLDKPNSTWLSIDEAINAAIPTAVRKILLNVKQTEFS